MNAMNKIKKIAFAVIMILSIFIMPLSAQSADYGSYLNAAVDFMQDLFYQDMNDLESLKAALRGMFGGLDDYSGFYDNEETEALMQSLEGNFVGIGAGLEKDASGCRIIKVYDDSPAQKAGLYEGDVITSVNGVSTLNKDAEQVASEIRGEEGTQVRLTIRRPGENADREFTLTRALVKIKSVFYRIEGDIAYIRIDTFNSNTAESFNKAMDVVDAGKIKKIMLDLMNPIPVGL
jgi:carboxyl-terminal processing protease